MMTTTRKTDKKVQTISISKILNAPIEQVWENAAVRFDDVALSNPQLFSSSYINGSSFGDGAERVCNYDATGKKYLKERIFDLDEANYSIGIDVYEIDGLPIDPDYTYGIIQLEKVSDSETRFNMTFHFRTKPAFLGAALKGRFQEGLNDYAISIEHNINTGEEVTKENFKAIKRQRTAA